MFQENEISEKIKLRISRRAIHFGLEEKVTYLHGDGLITLSI